MSFLDIIIPQYKETDEMIDRALSSISRQSNVDFSDIQITIINDGTDVIISDEVFNKYQNLNIKYLKNEKNIGAGPTRQRGIDESNAKYITFLDADDELFDTITLYYVIECLKDTGVDIVFTNTVEERLIDSKILLFQKEADAFDAILHGRFIRKEFLVENDIRFSSELRNNYEDSFFITCLIANPDNMKMYHLKLNSYKRNINSYSITRSTKKDYLIATVDDAIKRTYLAYDYLKKKNSPLKDWYIIGAINYYYLLANSSLLKGQPEEKARLLKEVDALYREGEDAYKKMQSLDLKNKYNAGINQLEQMRENIVIYKTFNDFKKEIMKKRPC